MIQRIKIKDQNIHQIEDIEFRVIYSARRSIGISVLPDSSVIVRVPLFTSGSTIERVIRKKYSWILKHRDYYRETGNKTAKKLFITGETHLFRGNEYVLRVENSNRQYVRCYDGVIEIGTNKPDDSDINKKTLYKWYKNEASVLFPELLERVADIHKDQMLRPQGLIIRTMKRRWGSCSNKGIITLSTELVRLNDKYIEYVIMHELCHLRHHNHGPHFYQLLSEICPEWKTIRRELKIYVQ